MVAARVGAAVLAAALLAAGCGGDEREDVESYIREVNTLQQELLVPLTEASAAYRSFSTSEKELTKLRPKLIEAEASVRRLDRRVAQLRPPDDARRLHERLRELTGAQVALADELERTSAYMPAYLATLRPLDAAEKALRTELRAARNARAQAQAIRRFEAAVDEVLRQLRGLDVPRLANAEQGTQTRTLEKLAASAGDLARALERGDRQAEVLRLVQRFANAPLSGRSASAQRARIAAVRAYNARVDRVSEAARAVEQERLRLEQSLG
jgi:hypothetical protein